MTFAGSLYYPDLAAYRVVDVGRAVCELESLPLLFVTMRMDDVGTHPNRERRDC